MTSDNYSQSPHSSEVIYYDTLKNKNSTSTNLQALLKIYRLKFQFKILKSD